MVSVHMGVNDTRGDIKKQPTCVVCSKWGVTCGRSEHRHPSTHTHTALIRGAHDREWIDIMEHSPQTQSKPVLPGQKPASERGGKRVETVMSKLVCVCVNFLCAPIFGATLRLCCSANMGQVSRIDHLKDATKTMYRCYESSS